MGALAFGSRKLAAPQVARSEPKASESPEGSRRRDSSPLRRDSSPRAQYARAQRARAARARGGRWSPGSLRLSPRVADEPTGSLDAGTSLAFSSRRTGRTEFKGLRRRSTSPREGDGKGFPEDGLGSVMIQGDPMKKLHVRKGGFTLIELMIVVAIIGILAAIAIPNFLRFQLKAKSSEGKTNLAAIRTAEQSYYSEFGRYVSANQSPAAPGGTAKIPFVALGANNGIVPATPGFNTLGWSPEGNVYFSYAANSGTAGAGFWAVANADI